MSRPWSGSLKLLLLMVAVTTALLVATPARSVAADTATIIITTSTGNDTLVRGISGAVILSTDPGPDSIVGGQFWLRWFFSNGDIVGPLTPPDNPVFSEQAKQSFGSRGIVYESGAVNPDSMLVYCLDLVGAPVHWVGQGELFRLEFAPLDTGQISIDLTLLSWDLEIYTAVYGYGYDFALKYSIPTITVVDCEDASITNGDANFDRTITSADIIYLVNHVFKGGPEPVLWNLGDVNCDGRIASADIITLVNFALKSGPPPCDVCAGL